MKSADIQLKVSVDFRKGDKMNTEIIEAILDLKQAEQNFEHANPEFIDIAMLQVDVSKMRINALLKYREEKPLNFSSKEEGQSPLRKDFIKPKFLTKILKLIVPQYEHTVK